MLLVPVVAFVPKLEQRALLRIVFDQRLLPRVVIADAELTLGLPAKVTAATGLDANNFDGKVGQMLAVPNADGVAYAIGVGDPDSIDVTAVRNGAANFGPFWHPDGKRIVFASNMHDPRGGPGSEQCLEDHR